MIQGLVVLMIECPQSKAETASPIEKVADLNVVQKSKPGKDLGIDSNSM